MKKVLVVLMALSVAVSASAAVITFDEDPAVAETYGSSNFTFTIEDDGSGTNNILYVNRTAGWTPDTAAMVLPEVIPATGSGYVIKMDVNYHSYTWSDTDLVISFSDQAASGIPAVGSGPMIVLSDPPVKGTPSSNPGDLWVQQGGVATSVLATGLYDTWFQLMLVLDQDAVTYDLYLDGTWLGNFAYNAPVGEIQTLSIRADRAGVYFDNVGTPQEAYEPLVEQTLDSGGVSQDVVLTWKAAKDDEEVYAVEPNIVAQHVYMTDGTTDPNLYYLGALGDPGTDDPDSQYPETGVIENLPLLTTYQWAVVEIMDTAADQAAKTHVGLVTDANNLVGSVWTFTTNKADLDPEVTAGDSWITWLDALPQTVTATVDPMDAFNDIDEADIVWTLENYPGKLSPATMQMTERFPTLGDQGYPATQATMDALTLAGHDTDFLGDWIGTDRYQTGDPLTVTLTGLTPGVSYIWTSTHHEPGSAQQTFGVSVNGVVIDPNSVPISSLTDEPSTLTIPFVSDGDDQFVFTIFENGVHIGGRFFVMNGFVLDTATPSGNPLMIDFSVDNNPTSGTGATPIAAGYQGYVAEHEVAETFTAQAFSALGTVVTVHPTWADSIADGVVNVSLTKTPNGLNAQADFTTDTVGLYTFRLTATDNATPEPQSDYAELFVEVKADACAAAVDNNNPAQTAFGFFDNANDDPDDDDDGYQDCIVDLLDLARFAPTWLNSILPEGPIERP